MTLCCCLYLGFSFVREYFNYALAGCCAVFEHAAVNTASVQQFSALFIEIVSL